MKQTKHSSEKQQPRRKQPNPLIQIEAAARAQHPTTSMAPHKRVVVLVLLVATGLVSGGQQGHDEAQQQAGIPDPNQVLGDAYIGCLEMGFSRCFADPTLICIEDAMVECSGLKAAAAPPATATTGPAAAPLPGAARAETEHLLGAIGGIIKHGITLGAIYIDCVEIDLATQCFSNPTIGCIEKAMVEC